jgi:hypothetical protein
VEERSDVVADRADDTGQAQNRDERLGASSEEVLKLNLNDLLQFWEKERHFLLLSTT